MRADAAIIGGTGVGSRLATLGGDPVTIDTKFGPATGSLINHDGTAILVLQRHGPRHKVPPHKINYRALAMAVKQSGANACFSTAATGGLRDDWPCGTMAVCHDFVDLTARNLTLFDDEVVHTDFSEPFSEKARRALLEAARSLGIQIEDKAIYVNGNGPRYETPYEIRLYRKMGGDVVGMTAATEAILMKEAGVEYACLAVVTNLAAGLAGVPLSHEEVVHEMERSGEKAVVILLKAASMIAVAK
jgi:5'-methylthioadenosine phosphorylase